MNYKYFMNLLNKSSLLLPDLPVNTYNTYELLKQFVIDRKIL